MEGERAREKERRREREMERRREREEEGKEGEREEEREKVRREGGQSEKGLDLSWTWLSPSRSPAPSRGSDNGSVWLQPRPVSCAIVPETLPPPQS